MISSFFIAVDSMRVVEPDVEEHEDDEDDDDDEEEDDEEDEDDMDLRRAFDESLRSFLCNVVFSLLLRCCCPLLLLLLRRDEENRESLESRLMLRW